MSAFRPRMILALAALAGSVVLAASAQPARADHQSVDKLIHELRFARDEDDREDAAEELGKIAGPEAIPYLQYAAAHDREKDVRKEAAEAIERINERFRRDRNDRFDRGDSRFDRDGRDGPGNNGHGNAWGLRRNRTENRIDVLIRELQTARDDDDRVDAAERLGQIAGPEALGALQQAARTDRDRDVREAAARAIAQIQSRYRPAPTPRIDRVQYLILQLRNGQRGADRVAAAAELLKLRDPRALPALKRAAVLDEVRRVRDRSREAIYKITGRFPPFPANLLPRQPVLRALVTQMLFDRNAVNRIRASNQLGRLGRVATEALPALTHAAIFDANPDALDAARDAAVKIRDPHDRYSDCDDFYGPNYSNTQYSWHTCDDNCSRHPQDCPYSEQWKYRDHQCTTECSRHPESCPQCGAFHTHHTSSYPAPTGYPPAPAPYPYPPQDTRSGGVTITIGGATIRLGDIFGR